MELQIKALTKRYGPKTALDDVSLTMRRFFRRMTLALRTALSLLCTAALILAFEGYMRIGGCSFPFFPYALRTLTARHKKENAAMTVSEMLRAAGDFWRPNRYGLKKYLLNDGNQHPFAVICPGGGYQMVCSYAEGLPVVRALNARGYHAFVVYYRVRSKARYPAPQEDLERAVREIFAHAQEWALDTAGYSLWGSSAGGHLAASFCSAAGRGGPPPPPR